MRINNATARSILNTQCARCNNGFIRCYAGTVPTDVDAALGGGNTLLAELAFGSTAFGTATDDDPGAIAAANSITADPSANATGVITFVRCVETDGTVVFQLTAGEAAEEVVFDESTTTAGQPVAITSLQVTLAEVA